MGKILCELSHFLLYFLIISLYGLGNSPISQYFSPTGEQTGHA